MKLHPEYLIPYLPLSDVVAYVLHEEAPPTDDEGFAGSEAPTARCPE